MKHPSGVKTFGHEAKGDSGKFHPENVSGNPNNTSSGSGGSRKNLGDVGTSGSASQPSGVVRGDGTEKLRGTEVKHKNHKRSLPSTSGTDSSKPSGVRSHSGLKAPKNVK